jgi:WXG100 family type VII secretion target
VIEVHFGSLDAAVSALETQKGHLLRQIADVERTSGNLRHNWDSTAQDGGYSVLQRQWSDAAGHLEEDIQGLKTAVNHSNGHYQENERSIVNLFQV